MSRGRSVVVERVLAGASGRLYAVVEQQRGQLGDPSPHVRPLGRVTRGPGGRLFAAVGGRLAGELVTSPNGSLYMLRHVDDEPLDAEATTKLREQFKDFDKGR